MSLGFLTPDVTASREVRARSPMERMAVDAGARLSRVEGWSVPNAYSEPSIEWERLTRTVAFADRSSLAKLEIQAEPRELARILALAGGRRRPDARAGTGRARERDVVVPGHAEPRAGAERAG